MSAGAVSGADVANESSVKAAFVLNFIKYTEWPASSETEVHPLRICSPSVKPLDGYLASLQGKPLRRGVIEVRTRVQQRDWPGCHVLYLDAEDTDYVDAATRTLAAFPVLLISDSPDFVQRGGTIGLRAVGSRIQFEVNLAAGQRAALRLSSHMLRLAARVIQ
jgi:hypothetical protein